MNNEARHIRKERTTAQALIELAVFGAVLFFVIGGIANNYFSAAFQQSAQLQSMRRALLASYQDSQAGSAAHASGTFLIYEDRLTGEFGKFGTVDRQPVVAAGNGTMSAQSMQISDFNQGDLPVMDLIVNGEHFVLRTDAYAVYIIVRKSETDVQIIQRATRITDEMLGAKESATGYCTPKNDPIDNYPMDNDPMQSPIQSDSGQMCGMDQDCSEGYKCVFDTVIRSEDEAVKRDVSLCFNSNVPPESGTVVNCNVGTPEQRQRLAREWVNPLGKANDLGNIMPPFFAAMPANDPDFEKKPQGEAGTYAYNLTRKAGAELFPKNGTSLWPAWRWSWIYFWEKGEDDEDEDTDPEKSLQQQFTDKEATMVSYDIDGDLKEEALFEVRDMTDAMGGYGYPAYLVAVRDPQLADVDPTRSGRDYAKPEQKPGMRPSFRIHGRTACVDTTAPTCTPGDVTSLDVKEGKLYNDGKQVAVSVLQKNQYDVIERAYQLNVDMGDVKGFLENNNKDGRKVLDGCGGTNVRETCFNRDTKTLYIRSRLNDKRGHKWITDTDNRTWNQSLGGK